jgi:DNA repair exonuclease SbcCD nuclease subunit
MITRILHTADWHLDQSNIRYTLPPVDRLVEIAEEQDPALVIHGGDYFIHRGSIHPEITWLVRDRLHRLANRSRRGLLAISGNHDQVFQAGLHDGLAGAVAIRDDSDDEDNRIQCATTAAGPRVIHESGLSFILIPTVNKYWLHAATETEDKLDAGALLTGMVQSLILAEKAAGRDPIVVYHGTFAGATLSNEQVMTAGMDIALPQTAVAGAAVVLAGHIHHAQTLAGPGCEIHYPGSIAPLTWNDKRLEPRALLVEVEHDEAGKVASVHVDPIPLPVVSQMIEYGVLPDDWRLGDSVEEILVGAIKLSGALPGDRLRRGPLAGHRQPPGRPR